MERSHNEKKKQKRKLLGILSLLTSVVVLCGVVTIVTLVGRQNNEANQTDVQSSEQMATSVEELRELLLKPEELTIKLEKDVTIEEPLLVNGTKKLIGKHTISMAMYAKPYQNVLTVSEEASLTIDGIAIDGNGIANGVYVDRMGNLELLSGEILYAFPHGVESKGKVTMEGGVIEHAMTSGMVILSGGEAYLTGGKIVDSVDTALYVNADAYAGVSEDIQLTGSGLYNICNLGKTEITGGVIRDAHMTLVVNKGDMIVQGAKENKLELCNSEYEGIWATEESTSTKIENIYLHDIGHTGLYMKAAKNVEVQNITIEDTGMSGINFAAKAEGTVRNIEIKSAGTVALSVRDGSDVAAENIMISSPKMRGVMCLGGKLTAENIEITSPGDYGITCAATEKFEGTAIFENLTIEDVEKRNGINVVSGAFAQITNGSISGIKNKHGAKIHGEGSKLVLQDVDIEDCTQIGIVAMSKGTVELQNVNISDCGGKGISAASGATVTYSKGAMDGFREVAVYINRSKVSLLGVTLGGLDSHGVYNNSGSVELKSVTINKAGNAGLFCINQGSTATIDNLVIREPKERGIRCEGGVITGKNVEVTGSTTYAITSNVKNGTTGSVTLENVKISDVKNGKYAINVLEGSYCEITGGNINEGKTGVGARAYGENSKLVLNNVDIINCGTSGVVASNNGEAVLKKVNIRNCGDKGLASYHAKITANGGSIKDTTSVAVYLNKGTVSLNSVAIDDIESHGVYNNSGMLELDNVTITKAGDAGIYLVNRGSVANIENTVVREPKERGIRCEGGIITGKNVEVSGATTYAITSNIKEETIGSVTLENVKISDVKNGEYAINVVAGSYCEINGGTIDGCDTGIGARAYGESSKLVLTDVDIQNCGAEGVLTNTKGVAVLENVNISNCKKAVSANGGSKITAVGGIMKDSPDVMVYNNASTVILTGVVVNTPISHGIYNNNGTVEAYDIEITEVPNNAVFTKGENGITILSKVNKGNTISGSGNNDIYACEGGTIQISDSILSEAGSHSVFSQGGTIELTAVTIEKPGKVGVYNEAGSVKLDGVEIQKAGSEGVYLMYKDSTAEINRSKIVSSGGRGIRCEGGIVTGEEVDIVSPKKYGITSNEKDGTVGSVTLKEVTISNVVDIDRAINVVGGSYCEINGGTIDCEAPDGSKAGTGVRAYDENSKLVLRGVSILNCKVAGLIADNKGMAELENVNIKECDSYGIFNRKGTVTLNTVSVEGGNGYGIYSEKGTVKGNGVTISGAGKSSVYAKGSNALVELKNLSASGNKSGAGLYVEDSAVLKVTKDSVAAVADNANEHVYSNTVTTTPSHGIHCVNATLELADVKISDVSNGHGIYCDGGKVTGNGVMIADIKKVNEFTSDLFGIKCDKASGGNAQSVELNNLNITLADVNYGIRCEGSYALTVNGGEINTTRTHGCYVKDEGTNVQMKNVVFNVIDRNAFYVNKGNITVDNVTIDRRNVEQTQTFNDLAIKAKTSYTLNDITVTKSISSLEDWLRQNGTDNLTRVIPGTLPNNVAYEVCQYIGLEGTETATGTKYWGGFSTQRAGIFGNALSFASGVYAGASGAKTAKDPATVTEGTPVGGEVTVSPSNKFSMEGVTGVMWYVDFSNLTKSTAKTPNFCTAVPINLYKGTISTQFRTYKGGVYYYNYNTNQWVESSVASGGTDRIIVPDNYKGWIYAPLSSYISQKDLTITNTVFDTYDSNLTGITINTVQLYSNGYEFDTSKNIIWDEILFVKTK